MPSDYYTLIFTMIMLLVHLELRRSRGVEEKLKGDIISHCTMYFVLSLGFFFVC